MYVPHANPFMCCNNKRDNLNLFILFFLQKLIWNWSLKIICVVLMVLCNVIVWTFFVKALHQRGGSIVATVCSTATNYCGSVSRIFFLKKNKQSKLTYIEVCVSFLGVFWQLDIWREDISAVVAWINYRINRFDANIIRTRQS